MPDFSTLLERLTASPVSYNLDLVRQAWDRYVRDRKDESSSDPLAYSYVEQLWTDHIIVRQNSDDTIGRFLRVPFSVKPPATTSSDVVFGEPQPVREVFVAASARSRAAALDRVVALAVGRKGE